MPHTSHASLAARSIGSYAKGCLAGATALPIDGETWQVMRVSRNRMWGHPRLIAFLERISAQMPKINGWPGLLVGDIAQPRGGPMLTRHASHQIGLDADVWLTPMLDRRLSREEREAMSATNMVRPDRLDIDPNGVDARPWVALLKAVSQQPEVARIFVNAAIKKALCREAGPDRRLAHQDLPDVRPRLQLPHPHCVSARRQACSGQEPPPPARAVARARPMVHAAELLPEARAAAARP